MVHMGKVYTCASFRCDRTQLNADRMLALFKMLQTVPVPSNTAKLLTSASE